MGGRLFQNFQQGILRLLGHVLHVAQQKYPPGAFVGKNVGLFPKLPHCVQMKGAGTALAPQHRHIGMVTGKDLAAGWAGAAGCFVGGTQGRRGQQPPQGAPPASRGSFQQNGMGERSARQTGGQLRFGTVVTGKDGAVR